MQKLILIILFFSCNLIPQQEVSTLYYLPDSASFIYEEYPIAGEIFNKNITFNPLWENYKILEIHYLLSPNRIGETVNSVQIFKDTLNELIYSHEVNTVINSDMVYPSWYIIKFPENTPVFSGRIGLPFYFNTEYDLCKTTDCYTSGNSFGFSEAGQSWISICDPPIKVIIGKVITGIEDDILLRFSLYQNYPDPFNPTTNIKFSVGTQRAVSLWVYDILGNEIATLINEEKPAGEYEIEFDGNRLSSGIYFYKLLAGNYTAAKKLILLR